MFERVVTSFKELISMIAKRRVQKATQSIEAHNVKEMSSLTPNLDKHLKNLENEDVPYNRILHDVKATVKKATIVKGTEKRPPQS